MLNWYTFKHPTIPQTKTCNEAALNTRYRVLSNLSLEDIKKNNLLNRQKLMLELFLAGGGELPFVSEYFRLREALEKSIAEYMRRYKGTSAATTKQTEVTNAFIVQYLNQTGWDLSECER